MSRHLFKFVNNLKLRWKMLVVVLPLVIVPIVLVGSVVGYIAVRQASLGITQTSKDDLDHMATFAIDLLNSHYQQFQVYKQDKQKIFIRDLAALDNIAYNLVESEDRQYRRGRLSLAAAREEAKKALRRVNVGDTGYIFAMTSTGDLAMHVAREGENIWDEQDENGRYFIREMARSAVASTSGEVQYIIYPWRNAVLGDRAPRKKIAAFRYFKEWDWIIAASGYLEETYEDMDFERRSFEELKAKLKSKKVGQTGYLYCMDGKGTFTIHPDAEGENHLEARDSSGHAFIREMIENKTGWIRYPWQNAGDRAPRMKIVRYAYFAPWDWIVAVGSYEDEFYREANAIKGRTLTSVLVLVLMASLVSVLTVSLAAKVLTEPIHRMIAVIRRIKQGRLDQQVEIESNDELGELAAAFNRMTGIMRRNQEMETALAQQGKMASLGVLSSGVAHEINNPLGVILGYASYLEGKLAPEDPHYHYIHEIKRESKRCKKIVQDLLSYARTPKPNLEETDLNLLLGQIADFAANHADLHHVTIERQLATDLPQLLADGDQLRQVAINLILNAGAAMPEGGTLTIRTEQDEPGRVKMVFSDTGAGIPSDYQERIFEPFFTTKARGTGLGLAITRQIVELHHGRIHLESSVGVGTTISVILPVDRDHD
ncbi:cache domain-containing protein [Desulfuromonas carbonis]|uniref:cache domain-containing protein n=1 Tax=Desulfuromonas sp. DDH964 TaxID=1823759 RepID=UPI00078BE455|nr:cache domain-containing protein [Desulfuromonas sp. DDH964]AMV71334.1 sensor histidine kinase, HAMP domain-containing [Desulfuromonas sp. DDH964]